eukprot:1155814-Pelagomonas_calceolata.AAC.6
MGLLTLKTVLENKRQCKKIKYSSSRTLALQIHNALQNWAQATQVEKVSPLDNNIQCLHYWSSDPRDIVFGAHHNSLSSKHLGISICHPIYGNKAMTLALLSR